MTVDLESEFLTYLAQHGCVPGTQLPPLAEIARDLGLSISKLREQLEVARSLGFVDVRPRVGIHTRAYSLAPGLRTSLRYALAVNPMAFQQIEDLREHLESSFWEVAVHQLEPADLLELESIIAKAWQKLRGTPIQIPHEEHRELHLTIFSKLDNPFVQGILEVYWDAYESVGLALYSDYRYLEQVWTAHEQMVEAIIKGDDARGQCSLEKHFEILQTRPQPDQKTHKDAGEELVSKPQAHKIGSGKE